MYLDAKASENINSLAHEVRHTDPILACDSTPVPTVVQLTHLLFFYSHGFDCF